MKFSIVIASHGGSEWEELALDRAFPSARDQGAEVLMRHEPDATRAELRNHLTAMAQGDYIITLDADDELAPGYVDAMSESLVEGFLLTPQVSYVGKGKPQPPFFWNYVPLEIGNWMVVGTAFPKALWEKVGGWRTFTGTGVLNQWDDWDLWIRMTRAGAGIVKVPDAVYVAHVRNSPHHSRDRATTQAWLQEIREANGI